MPIAITTTTLAIAERWKAFSATLNVNASDPPNVWTLDSGTLPNGITIGTEDGTNGLLSGAATAAGVYTFTLRVTDSFAATDTQAYTFTVTELFFPSPTRSGIYWRHFKQRSLDYSVVTDEFEFEDGGKAFNMRADSPGTFFDIDYSGQSRANVAIFDAFNSDARRDRTFSLIDKDGVTWTGVRIVSMDVQHSEHKAWDSTITFVLCKYP